MRVLSKALEGWPLLVEKSTGTHWQAVFLAPLPCFIPRILKAHFKGLQAETDSLLIRRSVSFDIQIVFPGLLSMHLLSVNRQFLVSKDDLVAMWKKVASHVIVKQRLCFPVIYQNYIYLSFWKALSVYRWLAHRRCSRKQKEKRRLYQPKPNRVSALFSKLGVNRIWSVSYKFIKSLS